MDVIKEIKLLEVHRINIANKFDKAEYHNSADLVHLIVACEGFIEQAQKILNLNEDFV